MNVDLLPASLLRQWAYCPRIPFFRGVLGFTPAMPPWVERGTNFDALQQVLTSDRRFRILNAERWQRVRRVYLASPALGIHGIADLILRGPECFIVCDYKLDARRMERGTRLQLGAYALMAQETWDLPCRSLAVLTARPLRALIVDWNDTIAAEVRAAIEALRQIMERGVLPPSDAGVGKCGICEHLNHCNDRD